MYRFSAIFSIFVLLLTSCHDERSQYGYVRLIFEHHWDGSPIKIDGTTQYRNAAGNILTFDNLEYLISDLTIAGIRVEHPLVHYINNDTANSIMLLTYQFPTGNYNNISFTFGLNADQNITNLHPNLSRMAWPVPMGGGYHYMMIDGKWSNEGETTNQGFGLHLGALERIIRIDTIFGFSQISQQQDSIVRLDTFTHKFHIQFPVSVPRNFTIKQHEITTVQPIIMDVKQWMEGPFTWNFNVMGGSIMSRERAMDSLASNGRSVFR